MANTNKQTKQDSEVVDNIGTTINKIKKKKYEDGVIADRTRVVGKNNSGFVGRKTKKYRGHYEGGVQYKILVGTLWEDIPPMLQKRLNWQEEDFEKGE